MNKSTESGLDKDCVFCERIRNGEYDDEFANFVCFEPLNPVTPGHLLIIPKVHTANLNNTDLEANQVGWALRYFTNDTDEYNIITSKGSNATQTIQHLHFHLIPRRKDDGLMLPWSKAQAVQEALAKQKEELVENIESYELEFGDGEAYMVKSGISRVITPEFIIDLIKDSTKEEE